MRLTFRDTILSTLGEMEGSTGEVLCKAADVCDAN